MRSVTTTETSPKPPAPIELWERNTVLAHFGGDKPLHVSTLYRGIRSGIYPKPITTSGNTVRWLADECRATLQRMISARDEPPRPRKPRGRPRLQREGGTTPIAARHKPKKRRKQA